MFPWKWGARGSDILDASGHLCPLRHWPHRWNDKSTVLELQLIFQEDGHSLVHVLKVCQKELSYPPHLASRQSGIVLHWSETRPFYLYSSYVIYITRYLPLWIACKQYWFGPSESVMAWHRRTFHPNGSLWLGAVPLVYETALSTESEETTVK